MNQSLKPFVKADKLGRICEITNNNGQTTPPEFKETLNMFRGRQLKTSLKECLMYLKLSLQKQEGDLDAEEEINKIHRSWNL